MQCIVCEKELKKAHKNACQFCGHKACEKCAYKLRIFANQNMEKVPDLNLSELQRTCRMGRSCQICDRKFFLREAFEAQLAQHANFEQKVEKVDISLYDSQVELDEVTD